MKFDETYYRNDNYVHFKNISIEDKCVLTVKCTVPDIKLWKSYIHNAKRLLILSISQLGF